MRSTAFVLVMLFPAVSATASAAAELQCSLRKLETDPTAMGLERMVFKDLSSWKVISGRTQIFEFASEGLQVSTSIVVGREDGRMVVGEAVITKNGLHARTTVHGASSLMLDYDSEQPTEVQYTLNCQ